MVSWILFLSCSFSVPPNSSSPSSLSEDSVLESESSSSLSHGRDAPEIMSLAKIVVSFGLTAVQSVLTTSYIFFEVI